MRTTVDLQPDVLAEVERLRRERGLGLSEAVNELVRRGAVEPSAPGVYEHRSHSMGARIDVTNISEVMDLLDES